MLGMLDASDGKLLLSNGICLVRIEVANGTTEHLRVAITTADEREERVLACDTMRGDITEPPLGGGGDGMDEEQDDGREAQEKIARVRHAVGGLCECGVGVRERKPWGKE